MKIDVVHVAKLANLPLSDKEIERFTPQLSAILDYVSKLNQVTTASVAVTGLLTDLHDITRPDDDVTLSLPIEDVLKGGAAAHNNFFRISSLFEEK